MRERGRDCVGESDREQERGLHWVLGFGVERISVCRAPSGMAPGFEHPRTVWRVECLGFIGVWVWGVGVRDGPRVRASALR